MSRNIAICTLGTKYVHATLAPFCLAAGIKQYLPEHYHRVRIVEATINQPLCEVKKSIVDANPVVAGFSCYIWNINQTLELCRELKREIPELIIILGGPEVSPRAGEVLECNPEVDYVLTGEGEESFPRLIEALLSQKNKVGILSSQAGSEIPGLCGRLSEGGVYQSAPSLLEKPAPSPLSAGYSEAARGRIAYFESSRGCPYSCAFCLSGGREKTRYFDLDRLLPELLQLAASGPRTIKFVDRTFNANPAHANRILSFILDNYQDRIPDGLCFHFEIAGDILGEETFSLLERMEPGAVQLEIGIQSFNEKTLEAVNRKRDTSLLRANIARLVSMGNMHIHIDLIAGLPHENLESFAESFNKAYDLGAQMLQLGFLKLIHGSAMRDMPRIYPCEYDKNAPYQVRSTPWLTEKDFEILRRVEEALDKVYNSGRFNLTAEYLLEASQLTPFEFYCGLGIAAERAAMSRRVPLDDYTAFFRDYASGLANVDPELLRDCLVRDRLSTNSSRGLPPALDRRDSRIPKLSRWIESNSELAPKKGVRWSIAILYGANKLCFADYSPENKNPVTGRYALREIPLSEQGL